MENIVQSMQLLITIAKQNTQILNRLDVIENKLQLTKQKTNDFNISTFKKASKVAKCSVSTLRTAVSNEVLKKDIDYKCNGKKIFIFSKSSLEDLKGTLQY